MEKCIILKNGLDYQKKRVKRKDTSDEKFFNEFKKFISRGNVMDMAVGIIIGGAFTSIVTSLVNDIINPILGVFGGMNFDQLSVKLFGEATLESFLPL